MRSLRVAISIATLVSTCTAATAQTASPEDALHSPALAVELQTVMAEKGLEAIATQDPEAPSRFIAILIFPKVQLLAVGARVPAPDSIASLIGQQQYRPVYDQLQQPSLSEHRIFFHDMGADGLPTLDQGTADVMYESGRQTLLDASVKRRPREKEDFSQRLRDADARYSRLLRLAIAAARAHTGTGTEARP